MYALLFVAVYFSLILFHRTFPNILGYATDIYVQSLMEDTNLEREKAGLAPVVLNENCLSRRIKKQRICLPITIGHILARKE